MAGCRWQARQEPLSAVPQGPHLGGPHSTTMGQAASESDQDVFLATGDPDGCVALLAGARASGLVCCQIPLAGVLCHCAPCTPALSHLATPT